MSKRGIGKIYREKDVLIISINGKALDLRCPLIMCTDLLKPYMVTACCGDIHKIFYPAESPCKKCWLLIQNNRSLVKKCKHFLLEAILYNNQKSYNLRIFVDMEK